MRRTRLFISLLFMLFAFGAGAQNSLVIYLNDGSSAVFPLAELPEITFAGEDFKVTSPTATIELPRADVKTFKFEERDATAIDEVADDEAASIATDGNSVTITGIADDCLVRIFNINGQVMLTATASNGCCSLSLEELANGLYIINYNNTTIKFLKK